jgi:DnaJ-class molecular chaperone
MKNQIYRNILIKFTDDSRDWLSTYFKAGDRNVSSDTNILVATPKFDDDVADYSDKIKSVFPKERNQFAKIKIETLENVLKKVPKIKPKEFVDCEACDGQGEVEADFYWERKHYGILAECPICEGRGDFEWELEDADCVFDDSKGIKILESGFKPSNLDSLVMIAKMLGQDSKNIATHFLIGDVFVVIQPTSNNIFFFLDEIEE